VTEGAEALTPRIGVLGAKDPLLVPSAL